MLHRGIAPRAAQYQWAAADYGLKQDPAHGCMCGTSCACSPGCSTREHQLEPESNGQCVGWIQGVARPAYSLSLQGRKAVFCMNPEIVPRTIAAPASRFRIDVACEVACKSIPHDHFAMRTGAAPVSADRQSARDADRVTHQYRPTRFAASSDLRAAFLSGNRHAESFAIELAGPV